MPRWLNVCLRHKTPLVGKPSPRPARLGDRVCPACVAEARGRIRAARRAFRNTRVGGMWTAERIFAAMARDCVRSVSVGITALLSVLLLAPGARGQDRGHPSHDMPLHEQFYSNWYMPDQPSRSCCNKADCYPTRALLLDGAWHARRREDGAWLLIPKAKIETNRDNPDGRSHLCAPPPWANYPSGTIFCFTLGTGA